MECRVRGKGRVPGGAVLGVDLMACLRITAQFAVVFAFSNDCMIACNTIPAKHFFSLVNKKYEHWRKHLQHQDRSA